MVIDRSTFSRELIDASGEFVLAVPTRAIADKVVAAGLAVGSGLPGWGQVCRPRAGRAAGLEGGGAAAHRLHRLAECRVIDEPHIQRTYDLFLGEVVLAPADPAVYSDGRWHFLESGGDALRSLHYIAGGAFLSRPVKLSSTPRSDEMDLTVVFESSQLAHIIDQAMIYQCACPCRGPAHPRSARVVPLPDQLPGDAQRGFRASTPWIMESVQRTHAEMEACPADVLAAEGWDMDHPDHTSGSRSCCATICWRSSG